MEKEKYIEKMKAHQETFDALWMEIVEDTNKYIEKNPEKSMYNFTNNVENFSDYLCTSGAWIVDRLNGKMPKDRGALTKKIRKALGYTYY